MSTAETIPASTVAAGRPVFHEQRVAARAVGVLYLVTMATAIFGHAISQSLVVRGDAAQTAANIAANEGLFRVSAVSDLITYVGVVVLILALYVVLKAVHAGLALLAAFLRLVESAILSLGIANAFIALRLIKGAPYLAPEEADTWQSLARLFLSVQGAGMEIGFVFLGFGSAIFSYLWLKSGYIPRAIGAWGIFASLLLALGGIAIMLAPSLGAAAGLTYMFPMFVYEVGLGLWLLVRGLGPRPGANEDLLLSRDASRSDFEANAGMTHRNDVVVEKRNQ